MRRLWPDVVAGGVGVGVSAGRGWSAPISPVPTCWTLIGAAAAAIGAAVAVQTDGQERQDGSHMTR